MIIAIAWKIIFANGKVPERNVARIGNMASVKLFGGAAIDNERLGQGRNLIEGYLK